MKTKRNIYTASILLSVVIFFAASVTFSSCRSSRTSSLHQPADTLVTNREEAGSGLMFQFEKGASFNHPLMALWIEDTSGNYLQTMYVAESIAKGIYGLVQLANGQITHSQ
ncbi:MAG: hypothetical protein HGA86_01205 [Anaerolineaceae bacterium]|nr:hypothetical protein [Anaerolineaceae bacterium]